MKLTLEQLEEAFNDAYKESESSDDAEKKVGAVHIMCGQSVNRAANTFITGARNLPNTRPDKYQFIIHAEANLVYEAARRGLPMEGDIVVCTLSPCQNCIRTMFQAGIREVYYKEVYRAHDINMLDIKITEEPYGEYTYMCLTNHEEK